MLVLSFCFDLLVFHLDISWWSLEFLFETGALCCVLQTLYVLTFLLWFIV